MEASLAAMATINTVVDAMDTTVVGAAARGAATEVAVNNVIYVMITQDLGCHGADTPFVEEVEVFIAIRSTVEEAL